MKRDMSVLERSALILDTFPGGTALSLAEVVARTGLPRSTTHRILVDLVEVGWLVRANSKFELGMTLFELGERVGLKHRLRAAALPFMQDLYSVTEQTVHLAVRDGNEAVYVEKIHGHSALALPSQIGGRLPLTCTAVGKALLGGETAEIRDRILGQPLRRYTPNSIVDPKRLAQELDSVRRTGIAVEREEAALGGCCLASPVMMAGRPTAALSVSVPTEQFRPELLAPAVRTAALALGRSLSRAATNSDAEH
ncbi:IclR family transcriptional regulator [Rhodococcus fascians]|nr:IclR family transcriptional regulator [Rhodococcus fascians]MBY4237894.1 IclR family transcriptional regulator [Rhodococcus fascians]MBY4253355.1 IclR family transcriptional regulator [Rhodococcus fascians]MBY4268992.1 IclR family transcriptional regulator [Rhodococcus fascians]MBY4275045.1 IclR family transcriptional regulator [Rhodococcus fascians]